MKYLGILLVFASLVLITSAFDVVYTTTNEMLTFSWKDELQDIISIFFLPSSIDDHTKELIHEINPKTNPSSPLSVSLASYSPNSRIQINEEVFLLEDLASSQLIVDHYEFGAPFILKLELNQSVSDKKVSMSLTNEDHCFTETPRLQSKSILDNVVVFPIVDYIVRSERNVCIFLDDKLVSEKPLLSLTLPKASLVLDDINRRFVLTVSDTSLIAVDEEISIAFPRRTFSIIDTGRMDLHDSFKLTSTAVSTSKNFIEISSPKYFVIPDASLENWTVFHGEAEITPLLRDIKTKFENSSLSYKGQLFSPHFEERFILLDDGSALVSADENDSLVDVVVPSLGTIGVNHGYRNMCSASGEVVKVLRQCSVEGYKCRLQLEQSNPNVDVRCNDDKCEFLLQPCPPYLKTRDEFDLPSLSVSILNDNNKPVVLPRKRGDIPFKYHIDSFFLIDDLEVPYSTGIVQVLPKIHVSLELKKPITAHSKEKPSRYDVVARFYAPNRTLRDVDEISIRSLNLFDENDQEVFIALDTKAKILVDRSNMTAKFSFDYQGEAVDVTNALISFNSNNPFFDSFLFGTNVQVTHGRVFLPASGIHDMAPQMVRTELIILSFGLICSLIGVICLLRHSCAQKKKRQVIFDRL